MIKIIKITNIFLKQNNLNYQILPKWDLQTLKNLPKIIIKFKKFKLIS